MGVVIQNQVRLLRHPTAVTCNEVAAKYPSCEDERRSQKKLDQERK